MRRLVLALSTVALVSCEKTTPSIPPLGSQLVAEFSVSDLAKSRAFYEGLGFKVSHQEKSFLELQWIDGHKLFLSQIPAAGAPPAKPTVNLRVGVANADEYWKRAEAMQARVVTPIGDRFYGERDFLIADPDGFGLRFASLLPKGHW
jgi:catechol 2,3-dioxygenase-like lactoylglutathione lyase family enzyme